ncbi:uncharacterized protein JCM6883_000831 [Sporobolomyces salmoneus]|uniref:uncharacterized protein n=1 Tax=Sporobolomyces salmoneus TaxID=183962 RepID=UPI0031750496
MSRPVEEDEESALRATDELLAQDDQTQPHHHHRRLSSLSGHIPLHSHPPFQNPNVAAVPRDLVASLTGLVVASAVATHQLPLIAQHSKSLVLAFPALHFGTLGLLGVGLGYWKPNGAFGSRVRIGGGGTGGIIESNSNGGGARSNRKVMALAGVCSAISFTLRFWTTRRNDNRLCEAVDLFVLPTILLILPYLAPKLPLGSPLQSPIPSIFVNTIVLTTFMAGFCLIGIYGSSAKLLMAVLRLPFEATALLLLKEGLLDEGRTGEFLMGTVATATITSLASVPFGWFVTLDQNLPTPSIFSILFTLVSTAASTVALLFSLYLFSSPLTSTGTLFARNFILLCLGSIGENGYLIRDNWLQVLFVYAVGTTATAWADPEVSSAVRGISSHREGGSSSSPSGYSLLNSNGSATPHLSSPNISNPTSPSLRPSSPPTNRKSSDKNSQPISSTSCLPTSPFFALIPFIPLLLHLLQPPASDIPPLQHACSLLPDSLRTAICPTTAMPRDLSTDTVDVVISYYDEPLPSVRDHLNGVRKVGFVRDRKERVIIYNKGPKEEDEIRKGMELKKEDEVIVLENVGREGETYLKHILLMYNNTISTTPWPVASLDDSLSRPLSQLRRTTLAAHTFFLQPHLAWGFIAAPRMELVGSDTGFAHLGPLVEGECGKDGRVGVEFPLWTQLFSMFRGSLCPPGGQTMAWSAQFVVSRARILANPYRNYAYVDELMSAPEGHWIHNMWGPNESGGPSNPVFGHTVERAWPAMFDCADPKIAKECTDEVMDRGKCTCIDPGVVDALP